jgi:pimeloyl-ACP methyl ester carboxylesterase
MSWVIFRDLQFDLKQIASILNQQQIPTMMITGTYDKIITSENMMRLLKHVDDYQNIVLETGHNKLISESADFLAKNRKELKFK